MLRQRSDVDQQGGEVPPGDDNGTVQVEGELGNDEAAAAADDNPVPADDGEGDESSSEEDDDEEPIPRVLSIDDPRRMWLTSEEHEWALAIKAAVVSNADLDNVSDLMIAQLAIITKGDLEDAIRRALGLQAYKEEYNILDTHQDGCKQMKRLMEFFPLQLLSYSFSNVEGTYVLIHDLSKMDTSVLNTPEKFNTYMSASYYLHTTFSPDLASIRRGCIVMVECMDMEWTQKQDFKMLQTIFSQLLTVYPFIGEFRAFHTSTMVNVFISILRRILPPEFRDLVQTGFTFDQRLNEIYLVPDVPTANQRVLARLSETLKLRYQNEETYRLL